MLIMFLLPFLFFAVIVAALWVAHVTELRQRSSARRSRPLDSMLTTSRTPRSFAIIRLADAFEPETSVLWETQVPALEVINAAGRRGLAIERLGRVYLRSAALYPELYDGSDFESWLQFLEEARLITCRDGIVAMSAEGLEFLKCRVAARTAA